MGVPYTQEVTEGVDLDHMTCGEEVVVWEDQQLNLSHLLTLESPITRHQGVCYIPSLVAHTSMSLLVTFVYLLACVTVCKQ